MTEEQREKICKQIAESWLDSCDLKDLERFFYDAQLEAPPMALPDWITRLTTRASNRST